VVYEILDIINKSGISTYCCAQKLPILEDLTSRFSRLAYSAAIGRIGLGSKEQSLTKPDEAQRSLIQSLSNCLTQPEGAQRA
jgi:hypothetical protein